MTDTKSRNASGTFFVFELFAFTSTGRLLERNKTELLIKFTRGAPSCQSNFIEPNLLLFKL